MEQGFWEIMAAGTILFVLIGALLLMLYVGGGGDDRGF